MFWTEKLSLGTLQMFRASQMFYDVFFNIHAIISLNIDIDVLHLNRCKQFNLIVH